jgi:hypothetical protein
MDTKRRNSAHENLRAAEPNGSEELENMGLRSGDHDRTWRGDGQFHIARILTGLKEGRNAL